MQSQFLGVLALVLLPVVASAATLSGANIPQSDKLVILSTTDVKGKTGPCGCNVPKGGLSRRAAFSDSIRAQFGQVALVDAGGFFPEGSGQENLASFLMDAMKLLNTDAVGVAERDLRYGASFLAAQTKSRGLPIVCANLIDKRSGKPLFDPYLIKKVGAVKVGFFSLIGERGDLGPSRDSLLVEAPAAVATRTIAEMKKKGADVVVLLGQLGKVENEDLVTAVDGVNALVVGHETSAAKGRMIKNTVACYGGDQGHYVCMTVLRLDSKRQVTTAEADAVMLGPAVSDQPTMLDLVKSFAPGPDQKLQQTEADRTATASKPGGGSR